VSQVSFCIVHHQSSWDIEQGKLDGGSGSFETLRVLPLVLQAVLCDGVTSADKTLFFLLSAISFAVLTEAVEY